MDYQEGLAVQETIDKELSMDFIQAIQLQLFQMVQLISLQSIVSQMILQPFSHQMLVQTYLVVQLQKLQMALLVELLILMVEFVKLNLSRQIH